MRNSLNIEKLKDPQFRVSAFFNATPDLVCVAGKDGFFKKVNPAVVEKLGYTEEELMSLPIDTFIYEEDRDFTGQERAQLFNGKVLLNFQNRYVKKNGQIVWLEWTSIYFPEDEIVFAIAKDITGKKLIEKEVEQKYLKFKGLASHFKSSMEEDRKYLSDELHEELAQLVYVLKMDIDWINSHTQDLQEPVKSKIDHARIISGLLIDTIRRVSFSISPSMLDDLGLNASIEWLCSEFTLLNETACYFEGDYDEDALTQEVKIDFFRICQECLTNIMYHAMATKVDISIKDIGDKIRLSISDDGKGFDAEQHFASPGLTRMRERAASINSHIEILTKPGEGSKITVTIAK
jgi:PAS domain S-box-containing protein